MSLGFNFATLTNYNTGPDNGTPTKVDPASATNGFVGGTVIAPQHVNYLINLIADQLTDALDGVNGGTYTLAAPLIFAAGADVRLNNALEVLATGVVDLNPGAELTVQAGADIDLAGELNINSGGQILGQAGGLVRLEDSEDLTINATADLFILTMTPQSQTLASSLPTWLPLASGAGFSLTNVTGTNLIVFSINLPPGDTISSVVATVNGGGSGGGHSALPAGGDRLAVELVSVTMAGVVTSLALRFDQSASVGAYDVSHVINLAVGNVDTGAMPQVVGDSARYYVIIHGESGANAEVDTTVVTGIHGSCIARAYRSSTMVY